jgi:Secretion system C-terminal sorting domain
MKLKSTFIIIAIIITSTLKAQMMMNSVGVLAGTSSTVSAYNFKSIAACIDVQSGVAVLKGVRANGDFVINCEVVMHINSLGIKLFPNPVNNNTNVKFINTPPLTETFNLIIYTAEGQFISARKETGYNLFQGIKIDLGNLVSGTYILRIESPQFMDAIKFIKAK